MRPSLLILETQILQLSSQKPRYISSLGTCTDQASNRAAIYSFYLSNLYSWPNAVQERLHPRPSGQELSNTLYLLTHRRKHITTTAAYRPTEKSPERQNKRHYNPASRRKQTSSELHPIAQVSKRLQTSSVNQEIQNKKPNPSDTNTITMATPIATLTPTPPYHAPSLLPQPSDTALAHHFLGRKLADVQAPAVVLDAAVVRRNCKLMLDTARELGVGFRAHVKTHKVRFLPPLSDFLIIRVWFDFYCLLIFGG